MLGRYSFVPCFPSFASVMLGCFGIGISPAAVQALTPGQLAAGSHHTLVVSADGSVRAWGGNQQGQLGDNCQSSASIPVSVRGLADATVVVAGGEHSLALIDDGTVRAWGSNLNGQLGSGGTIMSLMPVPVSNLTNVMALAAGGSHSLAVKRDGTVWAWGLNNHGQLGDNSMMQRLVPVQVSGLTDVIAVEAGVSHSYALKSDGTVWAWGSNMHGQLGDGSSTQSLVPVQVNGLTGVVSLASGGNHGLVVKSDGTAWAWGYNNQGQLGNDTQTNSLVPVQVTGLTGVASVAGGSLHSVVLMNDGTMRAWGNNDWGQLGNDNTTLSKVPVTVIGVSGVSVIASGGNHTMALKSDGSVWGAGQNNDGQLGRANSSTSNLPVPVSGINSVQSIGIGAGAGHSLSVKSDGTVWSVGHNDQGQLGDNTRTNSSMPVTVSGLTGVISATGGGSHSLSVKSDGTVWAWGLNNSGQLGNNSTTLSKVPVPVSGLASVTAVSAGGSHSLALKNDGTVWAWGLNANGQLGDNSATSSLVPVQVSGLTSVIAVSAGGSHNLALKSDGTVWAWGCNDDGQLGDNSTNQSLVPVQVGGLTDVIAVSAGSSHSLALKNDGTVVSWGCNNQGQLGDNTYNNSMEPVTISELGNVVALAGGGSHSLALKNDGTVWSWGDNAQGQLGDNSTTLSKVPVQVSGMLGGVAVAAGANYSMVLKEDGLIATWGDSPYGQLAEGMSACLTSLVAIKVPAFNALHANPSVAISSPDNNTVLAMGQAQMVNVNFTGAEGTAASVSLYHHGILLGTDTVAPFSFSFQPWTYGDFSLTALGIDALGCDSLLSTAVNIKVPFDSDLDGLPDWWELRYFSTLSTSPYGDADNDGLSNLGEYVSDNLPNDMDKDSDNDGVLDAAEFAAQHNVLVTNLVSITANKTQRSVELSWQNNYANATGYRIQRSMDAGVTWTNAATVAGYMTGCTVTGLQPGVNYQFRVVTECVYGSFPGNSISERTLLQRIVVGNNHTLAIHADGTVHARGNNQFGQLGNNSTVNSLAPVSVCGLNGVVAVADGIAYSLAVKGDGTVWAWGNNQCGQLGNNSTANSLVPMQVSGLTNVIAVSGGYRHSVALKNDGTVWAWGENVYGQLGKTGTAPSLVPVQVSSLAGVVALSCGSYHTLALKSDGTVWTWGKNSYGQLGDNSTASSCVPVQVGGLSNVMMVASGSEFSLALKGDGTVWAWGDNYKGQLANSAIIRGSYLPKSSVPLLVSGLSNVVELAAGFDHCIALKNDGLLWAWGNNSCGQLGNNNKTLSRVPVPVSELSNVISIAAGGNSLALKSDGSLWAWGPQIDASSEVNVTSPLQVSGLSDVDVITAGLFHSLALRKDGTVWAWGWNRDGGLGTGDKYDSTASPQPCAMAGLNNIVSVVDGDTHSIAVKIDGTVWAWGKNNTTISPVPVQVSGLTDVKAVSARSASSWALKNDGTVWTWTALSGLAPAQVNGLTGVVSISSGSSNGLALKSDGTVFTMNGTAVPVRVSGLTEVTAIVQSSLHSLALKNDGTVWVWGGNSSGQLGNNSTTGSIVPVQVSGLDHVHSIAAGSTHSMALKNDGTVWVWGGNSSGQLGNNSTTNSLVPVQVFGLDHVHSIAAGSTHSLALKADGTIAAWGDAAYGQLGSGLLSDQITRLVPKRIRDINLLHALPSVVIASPANPTEVPLGEDQTIEAAFTPAEGTPVSISFYHYGVLLGTDTAAPFTFVFSPATWGDYSITAEGTDSLGVISQRSAVVTIKAPWDEDSDFDGDGDGVYDSWEIAHYGNTTKYNASNLPDTDGDAFSDWAEYQAETDAADIANRPFPTGTPVNPANNSVNLQTRNRHMDWFFWLSPAYDDGMGNIQGSELQGFYSIGNAKGETKYLASWDESEIYEIPLSQGLANRVAYAIKNGTMPTGSSPTPTLPAFSPAAQWQSVSSYSAAPLWSQLFPTDADGWRDETSFEASPSSYEAYWDETTVGVYQTGELQTASVSTPRIMSRQIRAKEDSGQLFKRTHSYLVVKEEKWGTGSSGDGAVPLSTESKILGVATISLNAGMGAKSKATFQPTSAIGAGPEAFAGPDEVKVDGSVDAVQALVLEPKVSAAHASSDRKGAWIKLNPVDLAVDANRDGYVSAETDKTTSEKPFTFWLNDDHDVKHPVDAVGLPVFTILGQDDVSDGVKDSADNTITCVRDLEDFTRLHLSLGPFIEQIKNGSITVGLEFVETNDTKPAVKVYRAYEEDGGLRYLLDNTVGEAQLAEAKFNTSRGMVSAESGLKFSSDMWDTLSPANSTCYLIFEGVATGKGKLQLTLYKGEGKLCSVGEVWLDLKPIKKMYQRWNANEVESPGVQWEAWPAATATTDTDSTSPPSAKSEDEKDFILYVHGWNMSKQDKRLFSETAYKRLWQIGYKGRFGAFYWPTYYTTDASPLTEKLDPRNFDGSEHRAWESSDALLGLFKQLNEKYPGRLHVMAHSMGNVVASEALHKSSSVVVKNYISSQSALAADVFKLNPDVTSQWEDVLLKTIAGLEVDLPEVKAVTTPNVYAYYYANGRDGVYREQQFPEIGTPYMQGIGGAAKWHNYYNQDDWALGLWIYNQSQKPHTGQVVPLWVWAVPYAGPPIGGHVSAKYLTQRSYEYRQFFDKRWGFYVDEPPQAGRDHGIYTPESTYEIFCYAAQARSNPTGRQQNVCGPFINADQKSFSSFGDKHPGHSAQFLYAMSNEDIWPYWDKILDSCKINHLNPYHFIKLR